MACNLCTEVLPDSTKLISILSDEGRRLQLRQILLKHLEINTTFQNVYCICRTCSDILCAFHELYIHVKSKGDAAAAALDSCHQSDSDEPLAVLCKELKFESCDLKSELKVDWHTAASPGKPTQRRSRRLVARASKGGIIEQEQHQALEEVDKVLAVKEEETEELSATFEMALSDVDAAPHSAGAASEDEANTVNVLPTCDMLQLDNVQQQRCTTTRRRGRAKKVLNPKATAAPPSVQQTHKTQITKEYDEYLAKNFKLSCCLCQEPLANFVLLKKHFRGKHQMRGYVLCCGKKLLKRGVLVDHIRTHFDPDYFKCGICQKVASDRRCLEMHMSRHGQQRERNFKCDVCFKSYFRRSIFMRHMLLHVPEDQKKVHCPQCEKVFATKYIMNQHLKLVHLNMYAKICDICGKSIRGRDAFQRHQLEHAGQPKPLVPCEECGLKFSNKYGLSRHMKVMHSAENLRTQVCSICSKISPNMSAHRRHMNYVHTMERKHACPMCEKAFKRRNDLKEHMTTHTGEVLYTCPHCPKTFNSNANMHSHRKKYHRKEWEEKRLQRIPHAAAAAMPQSEPSPDADTQQRHELVKYNNNNS